ncbi:MAG TPA: TraR/DksA C4-type zinc finger protein [Candidatus Dormibacteraeota bacterium]|nr:TraR/DksA C4-type zinc finger protein [Candidatus Dormibacteraeota bacterium]
MRRNLALLDGQQVEVRGDEQDVAVASEGRELAVLSHGLLTEQARRLVAALERLDAGEYGICVDCDHPIPPKRLEAIPEVETCLGCQERREVERRAADDQEVGIRRVRRPARPLEELEP